MIPGAMRFHEYNSGVNQLQVLDAVGYEGAKPDLRIYAVVHPRELVMFEFASFTEGVI
jgi:hypothetical protein